MPWGYPRLTHSQGWGQLDLGNKYFTCCPQNNGQSFSHVLEAEVQGEVKGSEGWNHSELLHSIQYGCGLYMATFSLPFT